MRNKSKTKIQYFFAKDDDTFKIVVYFLIAIIPSMFLVSFIHEIGHFLYAFIRGWDTFDIHFFLLPFRNETESYIFVSWSPANEIDALFFAMSGSLFNLICAYIFFALFYRFKLPRLLEVGLFLYSIICFLDMVMYILVDIYIYQFGDWMIVYNISPELIFFLLCFLIVNILLYIRFFNTIEARMELDRNIE